MKRFWVALALLSATSLALAQFPAVNSPLSARLGIQDYSDFDHYWPAQQERNALNMRRLRDNWVRLDIKVSDFAVANQYAPPNIFLSRQQALQNQGFYLVYVVEPDMSASNGTYGSTSWVIYNANVAAAAIQLLDNPKIIWEIYNEPNLNDGSNLPSTREAAFIALQKQVQVDIANFKRKPTIVGPTVSTFQYGTSGNIIPEQFIKDCSAIVQYWKAISIHFYENGTYQAPEAMISELETLKNATNLPLVVSEAGTTDGAWVNQVFNQTDRSLQARQVLVNLLICASKSASIIVLYELNDEDKLAAEGIPGWSFDFSGQKAAEPYFGLFSGYYEPGYAVNDLEEKEGDGSNVNSTALMAMNPSGAAIMRLMQQLEGYIPIDLEISSTHYIARYRNPSGKMIEVHWSSATTGGSVLYTDANQFQFPYFPVVVPVTSWTQYPF